MPFNKYFQDELSYLREMGREFSQAYPTLAPLLADRGGDPDVERLLEGFAFLTGRIREKLDDELPELMHTVSRLLFPQLIRPLPSTSMLEFQPLPSALRERRLVPRGTEVQSIPIDGTSCRFRTTSPCELVPWTLDKVQLQDVGREQELRLEFTLLQPGELGRLLPETLSLHLGGESRDALAVLAHVVKHATGVTIFDVAKGSAGSAVRLPKESVRLGGLGEDQALLPEVETAFSGFRLLQEYYILPSKFAFLEIAGFQKATALGAATRIGVTVHLDQRMNEVRRLGTDTVKLHATPVVNVFETTAEPIRLNRKRERFLVRPAGLPVGQGDVYSIERVQTTIRGGERITIPSFLSFDHASELESKTRLFYTEHLRSTVVGDGADAYLGLGTPEDSGSIPDAEVLSVDLLATNGPLANAVRAGEITKATPSSPPFAKFTNLSAATMYVPPPLGHDLQWRATAHAAMNLRALTEPAILRTVLAVYNLQAIVDRQAARANELRIEAVRDVRVKPAEKLYRGASIRGVHVEVDVDEAGFSGDGDIYLFGTVLERLFAEYVSINSFSRTTLRGMASNLEYRWPARSGNQMLL